MYENTFSADKEKIIQKAIRNAEAGIENSLLRIDEIKEKLAEHEQRVAKYQKDLDKLKTAYPDLSPLNPVQAN